MPPEFFFLELTSQNCQFSIFHCFERLMLRLDNFAGNSLHVESQWKVSVVLSRGGGGSTAQNKGQEEKTVPGRRGNKRYQTSRHSARRGGDPVCFPAQGVSDPRGMKKCDPPNSGFQPIGPRALDQIWTQKQIWNKKMPFFSMKERGGDSLNIQTPPIWPSARKGGKPRYLTCHQGFLWSWTCGGG